VHADAGIGGPRPARHKADAWTSAQLALGLGHEGGTAFLAAGHEADAVTVLVKAVEHGQIAFARHAETGLHALGDEGFDEGVAGGAGGRSLSHGVTLRAARRSSATWQATD